MYQHYLKKTPLPQVNSLLIRKMEHKRRTLPELVQMIDETFVKQTYEFERALYDCGRYRLVSSQQRCSVRSQSRWDALTPNQKQKRIEKILKGAKTVRAEPHRETVISMTGCWALPNVVPGIKRKPGQKGGSGRGGRVRARGAKSRRATGSDTRG